MLGIVAFLATMGIATSTARHADEDEAIRAVIEHYFKSGMNARKAFHPEATMWYVRDGTLQQVPIQEYVARVEASAQAGEVPAGVTKRIVSIDRAGTAATAKLELRYPDSHITDYMALLKVNGRWHIVNKIFDRRAPSP